jgi:hypothetical protein
MNDARVNESADQCATTGDANPDLPTPIDESDDQRRRDATIGRVSPAAGSRGRRTAHWARPQRLPDRSHIMDPDDDERIVLQSLSLTPALWSRRGDVAQHKSQELR